MPRPTEIATVIVQGRRFEDWETVWVQHRYGESSSLFRFTCAEREPPIWENLQFKPGDDCEILLAGLLAAKGIILIRQVAYDAENHAVMLEGKGNSWWAARSSVDEKDGNFDNMKLEDIARRVLSKYGTPLKTIGKINPLPFDKLQNEPGELVWDFLERIARPRGVILGSDHEGNFLLVDDHVGTVIDYLAEGVNILKCQCVISSLYPFTKYELRGQCAATDDQHGTDASEQTAEVYGSAKRYSKLITVAEQPVKTKAELQDRCKNEALWHEGTIIECTIVVQGWLTNSGQLWRAGELVVVNSPMAMLYNFTLAIQTITFTQDRESGTLTTLDLVAPWLLKVQGTGSDVGGPMPADPASFTQSLAEPPDRDVTV